MDLRLAHQVEIISIHAPAEGATGDGHQHEPIVLISIHAPAEGATGGVTPTEITPSISIHAPAEGATATSGGFSPVNP